MNMQKKISDAGASSITGLTMLRHGHEYPGASFNARTTGRDQDIDALAASIKAEGILQSLLVCPGPNGDKHFYVIAGNRRLAALRKLKWDGEIPVIIRQDVTPGSALAMSLAENITQCPLHPIDRFETFAALVKAGKTEADIAAAFSISDRVVKQSLALGGLSPKIRDAWRKGEIDAAAAKAFTLAEDHKAQDAAFDHLKKKRWLHHPSFVREAIVGDQSSTKKFLTFVGRKAYEAAGGKIQEDLFALQPGQKATDQDEEDDVPDFALTVADFPLLVRLAGEKMKAKCDELVAAGWSWAADADDLPDHATSTWGGGWKRVDKASAKSSAEVKARSGVAIELKHDGHLEITYGLLKPGSKALPSSVAGKDAKAKAKSPTALSNALKERLEQQLTHATQDALKAQGEGKALAHLLARVVASQIRPHLPSRCPEEVARALAGIRELVPAKALNEALAKRFDRQGYFSSSPKPIVIKAIAESMGAAHADPLKAKAKAVVWKFAVANVPKTWLPPELRTVHYSGPAAKKKAG